ncbi:AhpC/TSA family protein [Pseudomonas aeruginosa]|nr:AhpC/TSA family protein [Pseudomonas aeruginosa]HDX8119917.1 AhpC/TSA family protein [Pseudomonas aeruginosa]HDZ6696507.1 AhpC/TSA family protein [Pseudomonas aeruginosa]
MQVLMPRQPVPALDVPLLGGGRFQLTVSPAPTFNLLVFYRGLHCPLCAKYLIELEKLHGAFIQRGVVPLALSSDTEERAAEMAKKIGAKQLQFGYALPLPLARQWGLTISTSRGKTSIGIEEPALFSEPGLFLVRPDGTLYWGSTQSMPFARPHFDEILGAIDFVVKNDYPARGEYTGSV